MGVRNYKKVWRLYLDMDGVVADFEGAANTAQMKTKHYKLIRGVYENLPLIEGAKEAVALFERSGLEIWFLTKTPSENPYSATEKLLWMRKHFPKYADRVIITADKGAVGTSIDVLIDDHPEWANAHNFAGTVLKFDCDWETFIEKNILIMER